MTNLEKMLETSFTQAWKVLINADVGQTYKKAITIVLREHPEWAEDLNAYVALQRRSASLLEAMRTKYAGLLETFLRALPRSFSGGRPSFRPSTKARRASSLICDI